MIYERLASFRRYIRILYVCIIAVCSLLRFQDCHVHTEMAGVVYLFSLFDFVSVGGGYGCVYVNDLISELMSMYVCM